MTTQQLGEQGFLWYLGTVEDLQDPKQLGRVRVRAFNYHDAGVETKQLPWAQISMDVTSASHKGLGRSPTGIGLNTIVWGFFADGHEKQFPVICGTIHTIPSNKDENHGVSKLARGTNTIEKKQVGPEPKSSYGAKYPFNQTYTTQSGHTIEIDDTPNKERIHVYHKSGSYFEINNTGQMVTKVVDKKFDITVKDNTVHVGGKVDIHVVGDASIKVDGKTTVNGGKDINVNSGGNIKVTAKKIDLN